MRLTALAEAGLSRRDFLKFMAKAAGAASGLDKLSLPSKLPDLSSPAKKTPVRIDFFPMNATAQDQQGSHRYWKSDNLSMDFNLVSSAFGFIKKLLGGDIYDDYEYAQYMYMKKDMIDLEAFAKKTGLKKLPPSGGYRIGPDGKKDYTPVDEGVWHVDTPYGGLQVTELEKWNEAWGGETGVDLEQWGKLVTDPIKSFWEQTANGNIFWKKPGYFDEKGLEALRQRGLNVGEIVEKNAESAEHLRKANSGELDQEELDKKGGRRSLSPRNIQFKFPEQFGERPPEDPRYPRELESPFESRIKEALLEAGLSRRDFLKFMGKAAGAAYTAPIGKAAGALGKLATSQIDPSNFFDVQAYAHPAWGTSGREWGDPVPFGSFAMHMANNFKLLSKLVPNRAIKIPDGVNDSPYINSNTLINKNEVEEILDRAKGMGGEVKKSAMGWEINFPNNSIFLRDSNRIGGNFAKKTIQKYESYETPTDLVKAAWEYYPPEETAKHELFKLDPKGLELLKSRGYTKEGLEQELELSKRVCDERQEKYIRKQAKFEMAERDKKRRWGPHERRVGFQFPGDEPSEIEKIDKMPFESRLKEQLTVNLLIETNYGTK